MYKIGKTAILKSKYETYVKKLEQTYPIAIPLPFESWMKSQSYSAGVPTEFAHYDSSGKYLLIN